MSRVSYTKMTEASTRLAWPQCLAVIQMFAPLLELGWGTPPKKPPWLVLRRFPFSDSPGQGLEQTTITKAWPFPVGPRSLPASSMPHTPQSHTPAPLPCVLHTSKYQLKLLPKPGRFPHPLLENSYASLRSLLRYYYFCAGLLPHLVFPRIDHFPWTPTAHNNLCWKADFAFYFLVNLCLPPQLDCELLVVRDWCSFLYPQGLAQCSIWSKEAGTQ